jgi:hypothetical protein
MMTEKKEVARDFNGFGRCLDRQRSADGGMTVLNNVFKA